METNATWIHGWGSGLTGWRAAFTCNIPDGEKYEVISKGKQLIAIVPHGGGDAVKDAIMLAAAPDMLMALERIRRVISRDQIRHVMLSENGPTLENFISGVINQARGQK